MSGQPRCNWCGVFVARWMPAFTWHRDWRAGDLIDGRWWVEQGEHLCWTDPQRLCPECALSAASWRCDIFAEVEPS